MPESLLRVRGETCVQAVPFSQPDGAAPGAGDRTAWAGGTRGAGRGAGTARYLQLVVENVDLLQFGSRFLLNFIQLVSELLAGQFFCF